MIALSQVNAALRRQNRKNYLLLVLCNFISVLLITAYVTMMRSPTVLQVLPEGGDSRKQVMMIFVLAVIGCGVFTTYAASLFFRSKARETGIFLALGATRQTLSRQMFRELAQLGIGFTADRFEKTKGVTQADMVLFLLSANGEYYSAEEMDDAYDRAYYLGILERGQRQEDKPVTRAELIKTILDMAGYGRVAWIDGIFLCSFQDAGTIPADYYNYAAIAQGMGMVQGNGVGQLSPNDQATRQQMAIMLYNFMNREVQ